MRKLLFVFVMLYNITAIVAQPAFRQPYGTENDYKRLWYLNIQYIQSWVRSDTANYDTLLWAKDFMHQSGANGRLYPKKEIMTLFGEKRFAGIDYFYADNTIIQFITDSAAMVLSRPPYHGKNSASESLSQYNDVYVKRNGNWICVSANITMVTMPNAPLPVLKQLPPIPEIVTIINGSKEDSSEIIRLQKIVKEIFEQGDYKKAEELLDNQFILLEKDGSLFSKKELLHSYRTKIKSKSVPGNTENMIIRFVAANVAMVHGTYLFKFPDDKLKAVQFNNVYVKRAKTWKLVSSNNTPVNH